LDNGTRVRVAAFENRAASGASDFSYRTAPLRPHGRRAHWRARHRVRLRRDVGTETRPRRFVRRIWIGSKLRFCNRFVTDREVCRWSGEEQTDRQAANVEISRWAIYGCRRLSLPAPSGQWRAGGRSRVGLAARTQRAPTAPTRILQLAQTEAPDTVCWDALEYIQPLTTPQSPVPGSLLRARSVLVH